MAFVVKMPKMGVVMREGTISEWLKEEGEMVEIGNIHFQIETDQTDIDYETRREHDVLINNLAEEDKA